MGFGFPFSLPPILPQEALHLRREVYISVTGGDLGFLYDDVLAGDLYHIPLDVDAPFLPVDI